ncbi:hypothetical protein ACQPZQ_18600 [Pseudonocardia sp. CA-142604]|uniref:hypothetical protein n=1 Tax=Pseudonocardia sp. CA-142604 TaxID=3240024 RepID=UPI003D8E7CC4
MDMEIADLEIIEGFPFPVFSSRGGSGRARSVAARCDRAITWLSSYLEMPPTPPLYVLGRQDWHRTALIPQYGLPHASRRQIVMGQEPSDIWPTMTNAVWPDLSHASQTRLHDVYGTPPDLGAFADLVVAHEITHLADNPAWLDEWGPGSETYWGNTPRLLWFVELFANVGLHGYICECEPESLPTLETVFEVIWHTSPARWPITDLHRMHESATEADADGTNYVWFEFGLQVLAKHLWEECGATALEFMSSTLHGPMLSDDQIVGLLDEMDPTVADSIRSWPATQV